jgi:ankyrin repeat protein
MPLHYAVIKNNIAMVELLTRAAPTSGGRRSGATPLHLAADRGYDRPSF